MKIKNTLLTSISALALSTGAAMANGSSVFAEQRGVDNDAEIIQQVGGSPGHQAGLVDSPITQDGNLNELSIVQRFQWNNRIVLPGGVFVQSGDRNIADIIQGIDGIGAAQNLVIGTVTQSGVSGATATQNQLTIQQAGGASRTNVEQINPTGGAANIGTIWMTGFQSHPSIFASVGAVLGGGLLQNGAGNEADVFMNGGFGGVHNVINRVRQQGDENFARVSLGTMTQSVIDNGRFGLGGASQISGNIAAPSSQFIQLGDDNFLDVLITGNSNSYGVIQRGDLNSVGTIVVPGTANKLGIVQDGFSNIVNIPGFNGDDNNVGLLQQGDINNIDLSITGNFNGSPSAFSGVALAAANVQDLISGQMEQFGNDNTMDVQINGSSNAFAMRQGTSFVPRDGNTITGTISGSDNAVAVTQLSNNNTATFVQDGMSNSMAITQ